MHSLARDIRRTFINTLFAAGIGIALIIGLVSHALMERRSASLNAEQ